MSSHGDLELPESDSEKIPGDVQKFTSDLIRTIPSHQEFSAREIFEKYPFITGSHSCMIDIAYEEFCRRRELGESVVPTAFAKQFPKIEQSLHRVIEFDQIIHQHPSYVESFPKEQWPSPGDEAQNFLLLELIGKGVLSRVFRAKDRTRGDRAVVAKVCIRGEQEATLLGILEHPCITDVHSVGRFGSHGLSIISMPYETRATLHHVLEELWSTPEQVECSASQIAAVVSEINSVDPNLIRKAIDQFTYGQVAVESFPFRILAAVWGAELANALNFAHSKEIYHCDVKPGNILVLPSLRVQLMDFNLAKSSHLESQVLGGTLPYMAPEQLRNVLAASLSKQDLGVDHPGTDVFGLCATLWHVVTGQPPFGVALDEDNRSASAQVFLERQQSGVAPELIAVARSRISDELVEILLKGLAFEPSRRFTDAHELELEFRRVVDSYIAEQAAKEKRSRRISVMVFSGTCVLVSLLIVLSVFLGKKDPNEVQIDRATNLVLEGEYTQARDVLSKLPSEWQNDKVRYLDLYCRTQMEAVPVGDGRENELKQILRFADEWGRIELSESLQETADLNEAFLRMQSMQLSEARKIAGETAESSAFSSYRQRIENCEYCLTSIRNLVSLCSQDASRNGQQLLDAELAQIMDSNAFRLVQESSPMELTKLEAHFLLCVEVAYWKSLPETSGVQTLQLKRLQDLVNDLVPQRLSLGDMDGVLMSLNCPSSLRKQLEVSDETGAHASLFILPPSRAFISE